MITASDDIKINGVSLGTTSTDSAKDKATAINAISASTNVTAIASAKQVITLTGTYTGTDDATINGKTVDLTSNKMLDDTVTSINTAMVAAGLDIVASGDSDGNLVLTSLSGANIITNDGATGGLFGTVVDGQGSTITAASNEFITRGKLTLTSTDGSIIKLTDGNAANSGLAKLGLTEQSEFSSASETGLSVSSVANASASLTSIDNAITTVSEFRASFGAYENRLDSIVSNLTTYQTNLEASKGRIVDADFAAETSKLTKAQILQQAATSMLAQANASRQGLLALLQG